MALFAPSRPAHLTVFPSPPRWIIAQRTGRQTQALTMSLRRGHFCSSQERPRRVKTTRPHVSAQLITNQTSSANKQTFLLPEITVGVIDDDIFEEDEYFYVHLSNPRVVGYPEIGTAPLDVSTTPKAVLGDNHTATVTIYDDDHAGKQ